MNGEWVTLRASSGYGANTRQPFVTIHWKDVVQQLAPEKAREFALSILEAAEAAEQDAFLVEFTQKACDFDEQSAAALLVEYRLWREQRQTKGTP